MHPLLLSVDDSFYCFSTTIGALLRESGIESTLFKFSPNFGVVWAMFLSGIMPVTDTTTGRESVNHHVRSGRNARPMS